MMPEMDGGDVAAQLRTNPLLKDVPVIFLTAIVSNKETGGHEKVCGTMPFLAKPVGWHELQACLAEHLGGEPQSIDARGDPSGESDEPHTWLN
jgi:CheY-like chemotaxis protein